LAAAWLNCSQANRLTPVMPLHGAQRIDRVLRPEQASLHGERSLLHAAGAGMADVDLADKHAMMRDGLKAVLENDRVRAAAR
jgi:hypothetical protein